MAKEDKLKVVRFKINKLLSDTSSSKAYEYYNGKKVGVPEDKLGIFKDLCEREKSLSKYVTISEEPVMERPTIKAEVVTENKEYNLGESVNIKDNSYIYTNSYDATDSTNKCTPYYNGSYDREVMGVTYELDGNLYTIYRDDMNASEKVNELINELQFLLREEKNDN